MHRGRLPGAVGPGEPGHDAGADGEAQQLLGHPLDDRVAGHDLGALLNALTFVALGLAFKKPLIERSLIRRREGYADYVARTSAFFPPAAAPRLTPEPIPARPPGRVSVAGGDLNVLPGGRRRPRGGHGWHGHGTGSEGGAPCSHLIRRCRRRR